MKFFNLILTSILTLFIANFSQAQCLEINSIFVNSCGAPEGANEMVTLKVGAAPLNIADITVDWPNNGFLGWCQNPSTASSTAALNATITTGCGWLLEPTGDVLPAGADVIIITSENFDLTFNSFSSLADTMYIIYQCAGNTAGHFSNNPSAPRTLEIQVSGGCTQTESVTYDGVIPNIDGATAYFDNAGTPTYVNNGCNAPVIQVNPYWSFTDIICFDYGNVNLNNLLSSNATLGGTWSGPHVTDSIFNSGSYLGYDSITYTLTTGSSCNGGSVDSTIVFMVDTISSGIENLQSCDSLNFNGTWYTNDTTLTGLITHTNTYYCDSNYTVNIVISSAIRDSSYHAACDSFTFQSNTYTTDTILYDTISVSGGGTTTCSELFFSEYGEGTSNNKYIEIFNGSGAPVNLANYTVESYNNGSATVTNSVTLSGTLGDGDVYVIANPSADPAILAEADITSNVTFFNGDDAIALRNSGTLIDLIGNIGCDPGSQWTNSPLSTQNETIVRNASYTSGVTTDPPNSPCDFPTLTTANWTALGQDNWSSLGTHTANCVGTVLTGCDTIVVTNIEINNTVITTSASTTCNPADVGIDTTQGTSSLGCDSIHYDTVTLAPPVTVTRSLSICSGDSILLGGTYQTAAGTYYDTVPGSSSGTTIDTFYTENFDGSNTWTLNTPTGPNGADNNFWVINSNEAGVAPGGCGSSGGADNTLHITSVFNPAGGASYDAGGFCGILYCTETNMAATSSNISTIGKTNIDISFDYIGGGDALLDNASLLYSIDGGLTFISLVPSIKSATCTSGQGLWTNAVYALPASAENIPNLQLQFNWTNNDDGVGTDPSVAINNVLLTSTTGGSVVCDSIITTNLTILNPVMATVDTSACDSISISGSIYTSTTSFNDTISGGASNNCDSIITYNITINSTVITTSSSTTCNPADVGIDTTQGTSSLGCDSIHYDTVTLAPFVSNTVTLSACDSIVVLGNTYTSSTSFNDTITNGASSGCDSITTYNITINSTVITTSSSTTCNPADVGIDTTQGTSSLGCDSIHYDTVTLAPPVMDTITLTACDSIIVLGNTYTSSTSFNDTTTSSCDTITTYTITINSSVITTSTSTTCNPAEVGIDTTQGTSSLGCDSIHYDTVTLVPPVTDTITLMDCDSVEVLGVIYTSSTSFNDTITNGASNGCDSITTYQITITGYTVINNQTASICDGDSIFLANAWQTQAGVYDDNYSGGSSTGCDSIVRTTLVVDNPQLTISDDETICDGASIDLTANSSSSISWDNGQNGATISVSPSVTTTYVATAASTNSCTLQDSVTITVVNPISNVSINTSDTIISEGQSVTITANADNVQSYNWSPVAAVGNQIIDNPLTTTTYIITMSNMPCPTVVDSITIQVNELVEIEPLLPTAFSPNGDGNNDVFRPANYEDFSSYQLKVYNRWGELIFIETGYGIGWDGQYKNEDQNIDVYSYYFEGNTLNSTSKKITSGTVTLIR